MYWLPRLEVYGKRPVRYIYDRYGGVNSTIAYVSSCDFAWQVSESGNKSSSLSLSFNWIIFDVDCVDCNFWRSQLICPFVVVMLVKMCLVTNFEVNPGCVVNWMFLMDLMKVECTGLKQVAFRYKDRSFFVSFFRIISESECFGIRWESWNLMGFGTLYIFCNGSSISHKPSVKFLFPCKIKYSSFIV